MWEAVSNPTVLDFAETVVGPFVQLDNLTLAAFLPLNKGARGAPTSLLSSLALFSACKRENPRGAHAEKARGKASGYHRDRWGRMPNGNYERPLAFNAITYLQDLTDDNGPVRRATALNSIVSASVPVPAPLCLCLWASASASVSVCAGPSQ